MAVSDNGASRIDLPGEGWDPRVPHQGAGAAADEGAQEDTSEGSHVLVW